MNDPASEAAWRRAVLPASEAAFGVAPAESADELLLVSPDDGLAAMLRDRGLEPVLKPRLEPGDLRAAAAVILWNGAPGPLDARAMAVLAAGRLLITDGFEPAFGLQSGIDFVAARAPGDGVEYADAALKHPEAFGQLRKRAVLTARRNRAAEVYGRVLADLGLEGALSD